MCFIWLQVLKWKKRQAYVEEGLDVLGGPDRQSFNRWTSFLWSDLVLLRNLSVTFNKRIWPITNASASSKFPLLITDPPEWNRSHKPPPRKKKTHSVRKTVQEEWNVSESEPVIISLLSSDDDEFLSAAAPPPAAPVTKPTKEKNRKKRKKVRFTTNSNTRF